LEENGDYEGVMNDLITELGQNRINLDFERCERWSESA
jgi:hypothetical protein